MDDDGTVRHALTRVIQGHGLATIEAGSGAEALAILEREGEIPLCISDVHMAEMDGVTFLREALRRYPDMAVIMLTGVADVSTAVECLRVIFSDEWTHMQFANRDLAILEQEYA